MVILGVVAVVVLLMLAIENMTLSEIGMAAAFVYLPLVCFVAAIALFLRVLIQKKKGVAYKKTLFWAAILTGVIMVIVLGFFIAGMIAFPGMN